MPSEYVKQKTRMNTTVAHTVLRTTRVDHGSVVHVGKVMICLKQQIKADSLTRWSKNTAYVTPESEKLMHNLCAT